MRIWKVLSIVIALVLSSNVFAANIIIDPSLYVGQYHTVTGYHYGIKTHYFENDATHTVNLADQPNGFRFTLDADGNISTDSTRVEVNGQTITFKTAPIDVDTALYDMQYNMTGRYQRGSKTLHLMPAGTGSMDFGSRNKMVLGDQPNGFYFYMDESGNLSADSSRFEIVNNTIIKFATTPVYFDPGLFDMIYYAVGNYYRGAVTLNLPPEGTGEDDFGSVFKVNFGDQSNRFHFNLDANGMILSDSSRIVISGNTISLNTVPVNVDTKQYELQYNVVGNYKRGYQQLNLVPAGTGTMDYGDTYKLVLGDQSNGTKFHVNSVGELSVDSTRFSVENNSTLTFEHTLPIQFDPGEYTGLYIVAGNYFSGPNTLQLMTAGSGSDDFGSRYKLYADGVNTYIDIDSPCAIIPGENLLVETPNNTINFTVSCPNLIVDTDEDGVADSSDNCPLISNEDQLDQDDDNIGNVCDSDRDGDTVDNTTDNCPDVENTLQSDLDGDGIGDSCDDDLDGDGIATSIDNCPLTANTGQEDNDADAQGDICDSDDDNDYVLDIVDNCPLTSNLDQIDSDGDGDGDICDGDVDGDGVSNSLDLCSDTSSGQNVTEEGCSGIQHVTHYCVADNFPNHGRFVKCVVNESKAMLDVGLISNKQKAQIIKQAAQSNKP